MRAHRVTFVILAGGRGERLWPLVRSDIPKVCLSLDGSGTLLESTLTRIQPLLRADDSLLVVTTASQVRAIRRVLPPAFRKSLLVEPQGKNTAACVALTAAILAKQDPTQIMVVLPADHWIKQPAAFRQSLHAAMAVAHEQGRLVTIGLKPTGMHPGLGHLCAGRPLGVRQGCRVFCLNRFVEKPSRRLARQLIRDSRVYWNAGVFVGRAATFLEAIDRWLPVHAKRRRALAELVGCPGFDDKANTVYQALRPISFDNGIMTHLQDGCIVEGRFAWEDLGSWDGWLRMHRADTPSLSIASRNTRILTTCEHLVATIGLRDVVVVHTPDVTLICRAKDAQAVRKVVQRVRRSRRLSRYG